MDNKLTVCHIDQDIHRQLKMKAAIEGRRLRDVVNCLLRKAMRVPKE